MIIFIYFTILFLGDDFKNKCFQVVSNFAFFFCLSKTDSYINFMAYANWLNLSSIVDSTNTGNSKHQVSSKTFMVLVSYPFTYVCFLLWVG